MNTTILKEERSAHCIFVVSYLNMSRVFKVLVAYNLAFVRSWY